MATKKSLSLSQRKETLDQVIFYTKFFEVIGQAIVIADENRIIRYWNNGAEKLYGLSPKQTTGKKLDEIFSMVFTPEKKSVIDSRLTQGESWHGEIEVKRSDSFSLCLIINFSPIITNTGELLGSVNISTDISDQKWAERELVMYAQEFANNSEKIQELNDKLRVVGSLTRHDIRNKLSNLMGRLYLLKKSLIDNQQALQHVIELEKTTKTIADILNFENAYEQIGSEQLTFVEVDQLFSEATALISDLKGLHLNCKCEGLNVLADSLLRQVLYNLIDNTLKYGQKAGEIKLYFENDENGLQLFYTDDGAGIAQEVREHLFEKGFGRGTGLGLYLMKRICETYGWTISERGKPSKGVKFVMTIPPGRYNFSKGQKVT